MARHRAQAQFDRARWQLRLLVPLWVLQQLLAVANIGLFSWRLGDTLLHYNEREQADGTPIFELVWEVANICMSFMMLLCTLYEMIRFAGESLTPWTMLFTHAAKLVFAAIMFALGVVVYVGRRNTSYSLAGIAIDAALITTAIALALYTALTYRRFAAYDDYASPANVKGYGFSDGLDRDSSFASRQGARSSLHVDKIGGVPATPGLYNHERDTQFDEYVARRSPRNHGGGVRSAAERALGAETDRRAESMDSAGAGTARSRGPSYTSDQVLVAVPEDAEESEQEKPADRRALLEPARIRASGGRRDVKGLGPEAAGLTVPSERDGIDTDTRWQWER